MITLSRRMRSKRHVSCIREIINVHKILAGKSGRKTPLEMKE
jgi:hypothetical protein